MARAYAFVLQNRDAPAPDVVELTSPFSAANTPKNGLTLSERADGPSLMALFTSANKNNQLLQIVTVSLPFEQDKEPATKVESLKQVEFLKLSQLSAGARSELINMLVEYYEQQGDIETIDQLINATSNSKFTSLCALNQQIVEAISQVLPNLGAISHKVVGNGAFSKVSDAVTVFRGGNHPDIVCSVKSPIPTISGNKHSEFRFPAIACKPLLSQGVVSEHSNKAEHPAPKVM